MTRSNRTMRWMRLLAIAVTMAAATAPTQAEEKIKTWERPVCVQLSGNMALMPNSDIPAALDHSVCVGIVVVSGTLTCNTETSQCLWPCRGNSICLGEWKAEPQFPYSEYAEEAKAVAEAAWKDPKSTKAEALELIEWIQMKNQQ